ncbi:MAG: hypothetical protein LC676_05790 [Loktanella sp.]|nr:hypothetical protein [Loktanella sp.]
MTADYVTITPGPTVHVWRNGVEVARVALDLAAACTLLSDLTTAVMDENDG